MRIYHNLSTYDITYTVHAFQWGWELIFWSFTILHTILFQLMNKKKQHIFLHIFPGCNAIIVRCRCKCLNIRQMHTHIIHTYHTYDKETCHNRQRIVNLIKNFYLRHSAILTSALKVSDAYAKWISWCLFGLDWIGLREYFRVKADCIALLN